MYKLIEKLFKIRFVKLTTYAGEEYIRRVYEYDHCKYANLYSIESSVLRDDGTCSNPILKKWEYI